MKNPPRTNKEKKLWQMYENAYETANTLQQAREDRKRIRRVLKKIDRRKGKEMIEEELDKMNDQLTD